MQYISSFLSLPQLPFSKHFTILSYLHSFSSKSFSQVVHGYIGWCTSQHLGPSLHSLENDLQHCCSLARARGAMDDSDLWLRQCKQHSLLLAEVKRGIIERETFYVILYKTRRSYDTSSSVSLKANILVLAPCRIRTWGLEIPALPLQTTPGLGAELKMANEMT